MFPADRQANGGGTSLQDSGKDLPSGSVVGTTDTQILTNKTLSTPSISNPSMTGTITIGGVTQVFPTSGLFVGTTDTQTLTNKSISADQVNSDVLGSAVAVRPNNILPSSVSNTPKTISVSTAPSYSVPENIATEFSGDFSNTVLPLSVTLSGTALGQPATGYRWTPATTPYQTAVFNYSGWNESTSSNDGRTGFASYRVVSQNSGQGDLAAYCSFCNVNSTRSGATSWLGHYGMPHQRDDPR